MIIVLQRFYYKYNISKENMLDGLIIIILLIGSFGGALLVNLNPAFFEHIFFNEDGSFYFNIFLTTSVDSKIMLKNIIETRLKFLFFLAMSMLTRLKLVFFIFIILVLGVCGGVMISENTLYFVGTDCFAKEYIGMVVYVFSMLPQFIFYFPAIYIIYRYCIKKESPPRQFITYLIICVILFAAGAFCEAYASPLFIKWLLKKL